MGGDALSAEDAGLLPFEIPGFEILGPLGEGGMAQVLLARQRLLQRQCALKVISPHLAGSDEFRQRFLLEARIAANLTHRNLVTVYEVGSHEGYLYLAMEYLPGGTLKDRLARGVERGDALALVLKIAEALDYVHDQGYVHRDVKPANILFRADHSPVLADFGIAKAVAGDTLSGQAGPLGTPHYMSPEQAQGEAVDGRSDYYSLGAMLYELLAGQRPYVAPDPVGVALMHITEPVPTLPTGLQELQPLIDMLMAKNPLSRLHRADELRGEIDSLGYSISADGRVRISREPSTRPMQRLDVEAMPASSRAVETMDTDAVQSTRALTPLAEPPDPAQPTKPVAPLVERLPTTRPVAPLIERLPTTRPVAPLAADEQVPGTRPVTPLAGESKGIDADASAASAHDAGAAVTPTRPGPALASTPATAALADAGSAAAAPEEIDGHSATRVVPRSAATLARTESTRPSAPTPAPTQVRRLADETPTPPRGLPGPAAAAARHTERAAPKRRNGLLIGAVIAASVALGVVALWWLRPSPPAPLPGSTVEQAVAELPPKQPVVVEPPPSDSPTVELDLRADTASEPSVVVDLQASQAGPPTVIRVPVEPTASTVVEQPCAGAARSFQALGRKAEQDGVMVRRRAESDEPSAVERYRQALAIDPDCASAKAGLERIASYFLAQAQVMRASRAVALASVALGLEAVPNHPGLLALRAELQRNP